MTIPLQNQQLAFTAAIASAGNWDGLLKSRDDGKAPLIHLYQHAFRARLTNALRENYPVLHRVLGDEAFDQLADAFITARPSRQPSIRWFGAELAAFVGESPGEIPHPALADLIRMEWALSLAFDGPEAPALKPDALLQVPAESWAKLRFCPHPTVSLTALDWVVEPLWSAVSRAPEADAPAPEAHAHHLLVWRQGERAQWRSISVEEEELLSACCAGKPFAELCDLAASCQGEQAAATAAGFLRLWVESGVLSEFAAG